jgi:hypothetical protein
MGEWSEYFEQFPEENPANFNKHPDADVRALCSPPLRGGRLTKAELAEENARIDELNAEAERLAKEKADFIEDAKSKPIYREDICPICRIKAMNIYKVSDSSFYCECQNCHASGDGADITKIYEKIEYDIWNHEIN